MRRFVLVIGAAIAALGIGNTSTASASCANAAAGISWDGGMAINGSSFVAGCSTGISKRTWYVNRYQEIVSPFRACAPGRTCGYALVGLVFATSVPDGQFNAFLYYCWEGQGGYIGHTTYMLQPFIYKDGNTGADQQLGPTSYIGAC